MVASTYSAALTGIEAHLVNVEIDCREGLSYFVIVGMADKSVLEAKDRIISAIRNSGALFHPKRIIVNLSPVNIPKKGSIFDLAIAMSYLKATEQLDFDSQGKLFLGELGLNGEIRGVKGILPIVSSARKLGVTDIFLPEQNIQEAAVISGINLIPLTSLKQLIGHFQGSPVHNYQFLPKSPSTIPAQVDLADIRGQAFAKRALEIAAAGGHNLLFSGTPGTGKTMLAKALPGILPRLSSLESIETSEIYSVAGLFNEKHYLVQQRPFRSPHHSISVAALIGSASKPGEISLAHNGVLFLDELPEFASNSLEALRQPLEDRYVNIYRTAINLKLPCNFMMVAAMNPCKCGYFGSFDHPCICTPLEINRYQKRISGPLLDRIDLVVNIGKVDYEAMYSSTPESSDKVRQRVENAREIQLKRYAKEPIYTNAQAGTNQLRDYIYLDNKCREIFETAVKKLNLSWRGCIKILKLSRTIADLANEPNIKSEHVWEAFSYRGKSISL